MFQRNELPPSSGSKCKSCSACRLFLAGVFFFWLTLQPWKRRQNVLPNVYRTTRRYIPEDSTLYRHRCENPKSNEVVFICRVSFHVFSHCIVSESVQRFYTSPSRFSAWIWAVLSSTGAGQYVYTDEELMRSCKLVRSRTSAGALCVCVDIEVGIGRENSCKYVFP
jgi:hypothetical protein